MEIRANFINLKKKVFKIQEIEEINLTKITLRWI